MGITDDLLKAHEGLQNKYSLKTRLVMQVLEDYHGDYENNSTSKFADYLQAIFRREVNQCCLCNHTGVDVNKLHSWHVGGESDPQAPCCDDPDACIKRVETKKGE